MQGAGGKDCGEDLKATSLKKGDSWGDSESVLIDGNVGSCTPGGTRATMIALPSLSGKPIWTAVRPGDRGAGHASIVTTTWRNAGFVTANR